MATVTAKTASASKRTAKTAATSRSLDQDCVDPKSLGQESGRFESNGQDQRRPQIARPRKRPLESFSQEAATSSRTAKTAPTAKRTSAARTRKRSDAPAELVAPEQRDSRRQGGTRDYAIGSTRRVSASESTRSCGLVAQSSQDARTRSGADSTWPDVGAHHSPSIEALHWSWPPTSNRNPNVRSDERSCAAMHTCPTSARTPRRSVAWSSTSTTLTRRAAWPLRMGYQALGGELRHRRTEQRVHQEAVPQRQPWLRWRPTAQQCEILPPKRSSPSGISTSKSNRPSQTTKPHLRLEKSKERKARFKATEAALAKAHTRDSLQAIGKLTAVVDGKRQIINNPPLVIRGEYMTDMDSDLLFDRLRALVASYRKTLQSDRRHLLDHFTLTDIAHKVVGVGSVGTRAWILLLESGVEREALLLQAKEAGPSALAGYAGKSEYSHQGSAWLPVST